MKIIVPLGIQAETAALPRSNDTGIIEGAFSDAVYPAVQPLGFPMDFQTQLFQERTC